jgi:hypothetical protein
VPAPKGEGTRIRIEVRERNAFKKKIDKGYKTNQFFVYLSF